MATASVGFLLRRQIFGKLLLGKKLYEPFGQLKTTVVLLNKCSSNYSYCTQVDQNKDVSVKLRNGLPVVSLPLPSRQENCEFTLKPITHTVGDFLKFIHQEDGGIDRSAIYADGKRISKSTTVNSLMKKKNFTLSLNDQNYQVIPPVSVTTTHKDSEIVASVKTLVTELYSKMDIEQYQLQKDKELEDTLADLKVQIAPLEKVKDELIKQTEQEMYWIRRAKMAALAVTFGIQFRLVWWIYSWDIMEPVTHFVIEFFNVLMFYYFVLNRHDYEYQEVDDRNFLIRFHKRAQKTNFDLESYNDLKAKIATIKNELQRLRDPLQLYLPMEASKKYSLV